MFFDIFKATHFGKSFIKILSQRSKLNTELVFNFKELFFFLACKYRVMNAEHKRRVIVARGAAESS